MKIDGVDFLPGFVEGFETVDDFLAEMDTAGYHHLFKGHNRQTKLKEVYFLHKPKKHSGKPGGSTNKK